MKKFLIILFISFVFTGCDSYKSELINSTDKIVIKLYAMEGDTFNKAYIVKKYTDKIDIAKITNFISAKPAGLLKCGYQGSISFYSNGKMILDDEAEFNIYDDCSHIVFIYKDRIYSRKLSKEGKLFLTNLYKSVPKDKRF